MALTLFMYIKYYLSYIYFPFFIVNYFYIQTILAGIAHNVPAVYDGLAARITALPQQRPGPAKCAGTMAWE
jgi:hypothetical protein